MRQSTPSDGTGDNGRNPLGGRLKLKAAFTLASIAGLLLTGALAAQHAGGRPPIPQGGREVAPGQIPHPCTAGETITQGYYFSARAQQWVAAPFCYGKWGISTPRDRRLPTGIARHGHRDSKWRSELPATMPLQRGRSSGNTPARSCPCGPLTCPAPWSRQCQQPANGNGSNSTCRCHGPSSLTRPGTSAAERTCAPAPGPMPGPGSASTRRGNHPRRRRQRAVVGTRAGRGPSTRSRRAGRGQVRARWARRQTGDRRHRARRQDRRTRRAHRLGRVPRGRRRGRWRPV